MKIDLYKALIIKIFMLLFLISITFNSSTDFPYKLTTIFSIIFVAESLFFWALSKDTNLAKSVGGENE